MNEGLARKSNKGRQEQDKVLWYSTHSYYGRDAPEGKRKAKEQQAMDEKEGRAALRGLADFGKMYLMRHPSSIEN